MKVVAWPSSVKARCLWLMAQHAEQHPRGFPGLRVTLDKVRAELAAQGYTQSLPSKHTLKLWWNDERHRMEREGTVTPEAGPLTPADMGGLHQTVRQRVVEAAGLPEQPTPSAPVPPAATVPPATGDASDPFSMLGPVWELGIKWAMVMLKSDDPTSGKVLEVADLWIKRESMQSDGPIAAISKVISTKLEQYRNESSDKQELTPSQWTELLCSMPERVVEALLQSPWLWHRPEVIAAVEGRDRVPEEIASIVEWHGVGELDEEWRERWEWYGGEGGETG